MVFIVFITPRTLLHRRLCGIIKNKTNTYGSPKRDTTSRIASALKTFWDGDADFREADTRPQSLLRHRELLRGLSFRESCAKTPRRRQRALGERRPPSHRLLIPAPQPSPRETCPEKLRGQTPAATAPSEPPHSPATLRPHRRPEPAAAPHSLQVVQGVDAAGGLPVPAAHPAAGAAEHAGGGRLLRPTGPTAS